MILISIIMNNRNFRQYIYLIFLSITLIFFIVNNSNSNNKESLNNNKETDIYKVKEGSVYDGDTMRVMDSKGEELKIRFACVDAPERKQPLGIESRDYLRELLGNNKNQVQLDIITKDRYNRNVAIVYIKDKIVPVEQVRNGWVYPYEEYSKDCVVWDKIKEAEKEAINKGVNIYSEENKDLEKPSDYRRNNRN